MTPRQLQLGVSVFEIQAQLLKQCGFSSAGSVNSIVTHDVIQVMQDHGSCGDNISFCSVARALQLAAKSVRKVHNYLSLLN